ncbi:hypothetical protein M3B54_011270 [Micrococcus luteus]|uniref:hypothetical protein n=1 Tax=Micrococcus luteus TaxID=1270 RepID=UPI0029D6B7C3|nr:hypothetical protein [Micrococcus luteus]MCV7616312.1 hypothetical protein [Micrococcus luteus]
MSTTAQTTAADLALALRATLAPLRGSSGASRRKGLIWFELTAAGSYRLTSTWQRQWARAHAPNPDPTPYAGPALPPCALNVRDAEELVAVLSHWRSVPADSPVRILADTALIRVEIDTPRPGYSRTVPNLAHTAPAPAGRFDPPGRHMLHPRATVLASPTLAHLITDRPQYLTDQHLALYDVPGEPSLTAWTLSDRAHGRIYLPARQRDYTPQRATLDALDAWHTLPAA